MNKWQEKFSKKMGLVRNVSCDRFEEIALEDIVPVFEEFSEFTKMRGMESTAPSPKSGLQSFKFSITENAYVLLTFRLSGLDACEAQAEFFVTGHEKLDGLCDEVAFCDLGRKWITQFFENVLDLFLDAYLETLGGEKIGASSELITA